MLDDGRVEIRFYDDSVQNESFGSLAEFAADSFSQGRNLGLVHALVGEPLLNLWEQVDPWLTELDRRAIAERWAIAEYLAALDAIE